MTDSVLIVGAGTAGLTAALAVANAGARAIVVERGPIVGGRLAAAMTGPEAIGDRAEGQRIPLLETLRGQDRIEILTLAELVALEGRPGSFIATLRVGERLVTDACTRCNLCRAACPVVSPNEFDAGLTYRKAIYTPMSETLPGAYVIDLESCLNTPPNYLPCQRCVAVCDDDAIDFHLPLERTEERPVAAVILAPGMAVSPAETFEKLGYGSHPDVLVSAELQRLLESPGPTGGYATRPSNEAYPERVLMVLDSLTAFALYIAASQVRQLLAQDVSSVAILVLAEPDAVGGDQAATVALAQQLGLALRWGALFRVDPDSDDPVTVSYQDLEADRFVTERHDLVVLCSDVQPPDRLAELADVAGVALDDRGYLRRSDAKGTDATTTRPGVFVAGCASGPVNVSDTLAAAGCAAKAALGCLNPGLVDAAAVDGGGPGTPPPDDELRGRIEQLLYGLLDRAGS